MPANAHNSSATAANSKASVAATPAPKPASPLGQMNYAAGSAQVKPPAASAALENAKSTPEDLQVGHDLGKIKTAPGAKASAGDVADPLKHPYWPTFLARVQALFARVAPPEDETPEQIAADLWRRMLTAVQRSQGGMGQDSAYSNPAKGWVAMDSPTFQAVLGEFAGVCDHLSRYNQSAFAKAKTFGFWSKPTGRQLAERMCDMTLETSGIGGLFDGMPSLDGSKLGWNPELWGALSRGYGKAVAAQFKQKDKKAHVCLGPGVTPGNIYDAIESKALERGALQAGKNLSEVIEFHAAAVTNKKADTLDVNRGEKYKGALHSGQDRQEAIRQADEQLAHLPG